MRDHRAGDGLVGRAQLVRDQQDDELVYICIEDKPRGELIVITLWEGGDDPRVPKRFTDALRHA